MVSDDLAKALAVVLFFSLFILNMRDLFSGNNKSASTIADLEQIRNILRAVMIIDETRRIVVVSWCVFVLLMFCFQSRAVNFRAAAVYHKFSE